MKSWLIGKSYLFFHRTIILKIRHFIFLGVFLLTCDGIQNRNCKYDQFHASTVNCENLEDQDMKAFRKAEEHCASLGMRLPTPNEINEAYALKIKELEQKRGKFEWDLVEFSNAFMRDFPLRCTRL